ncbi:hypothetical protein ANO11243_062870 [Dothideomycetidae sp. 11243]|nr:hypothetical protein ANO11243_062870 [fungal sp. No.11243]
MQATMASIRHDLRDKHVAARYPEPDQRLEEVPRSSFAWALAARDDKEAGVSEPTPHIAAR